MGAILNRRQFISLSAASAAALKVKPVPGVTLPGVPGKDGEIGGFPRSNYTPFGYLDNPWHTWDTHRSGILRSLPGIGFALYYPAGPGGYFDFPRDEVYEAHLRLGFRIGRRTYLFPDHFERGQLDAVHHSKNLLSYQFAAEGVVVRSTFLQVSEDALGVQVELLAGSTRERVQVLACHGYRLGPAEWWGKDGLAGGYDVAADAIWIRPFAAGTVCALTGDIRSSSRFLGDREASMEGWLDGRTDLGSRLAYYPDPLYGGLRYDIDVEPGSRSGVRVVMARGANKAAVLKVARTSLNSVASGIAEKERDDALFWSRAPQLAGDWPAEWKHGWVYDFETLRMMVRRPIGLYKHTWDAMQIQAPRNVLAETSLDMWALSYADPEAAKAVFLGQFLDALDPNVPCMREDGVMNMVAADGSECGTAISWCFPFFCAASIFYRTHDTEWLQKVYPGLASLLRWTLVNRMDSGGFLVGKCSWETGMDTSRRFLIRQPTGGETVEFLRLVELQAAASQAGRILEQFCRFVSDNGSMEEWKNVRETFAAKTQELWNGNWFHDFDTRTMKLVTDTPADPAQAAPVFCEVASDEQKKLVLPRLREMYENSCTVQNERDYNVPNPLHWSSFLLPFLESVWAAGDRELAAQVVAATASRIYKSMNRRAHLAPSGANPYENLGWPGVSCEIWGCQGAFGGEGYGWGAVMPAHIIRCILGFRETAHPNRLLICPNFPSLLANAGREFGIRGLHYGTGRLNVSLTLVNQRRIIVRLGGAAGISVRAVRDKEGRATGMKRGEGEWEFGTRNGSTNEVELS